MISIIRITIRINPVWENKTKSDQIIKKEEEEDIMIDIEMTKWALRQMLLSSLEVVVDSYTAPEMYTKKSIYIYIHVM